MKSHAHSPMPPPGLRASSADCAPGRNAGTMRRMNTDSKLKGKRALITGASAGFGAACAHAFAGAGADLELWARRADRLETVRREVAAAHRVEIGVREIDVRDRDAVKAAVADTVGAGHHIDILVNNAGLAAG